MRRIPSVPIRLAPSQSRAHYDEPVTSRRSVPRRRAIKVAVGAAQDAPFFHEAASWLARHLGTDVVTWPGAHGTQFTCSDELAQHIVEVDAG